MPKRRSETTAAGLLGTWTDSDTAMQIVGTSIGVFGDSLLDASLVLSKETPLRNALFDVLLSLVEGGTLDVRPTGDGHYAFRWRADFAVGALASDAATTVDIEPPSPYLAELALARRERDAAVARCRGGRSTPLRATGTTSDAGKADAPCRAGVHRPRCARGGGSGHRVRPRAGRRRVPHTGRTGTDRRPRHRSRARVAGSPPLEVVGLLARQAGLTAAECGASRRSPLRRSDARRGMT